MKATSVIIALALAVGAFPSRAEVKNDTIEVRNESIQKIVQDETTTTSGKRTTKYYFLYGDELIPCSRNTVENFNLCKKHGAKCHLAMVVNRKTNRKRIILH